ncbi:MAG: DctP family TRAP transporter solute-binding subunit [Aeromicrobium sp.]
MKRNPVRRTAAVSILCLPFALAACGGDDSSSESGGDVTLKLAHSYTEMQPQHACGADTIKKEAEGADVGLTVEIYPSSQLGGDADRIASVQSGDIDMDIQGASALAAVYEPVGVLDAAYAFPDPAALDTFMASDGGTSLKEDFKSASGVTIVGAWSAGARQFTANKEIREPSDLDGLRMRFPGSPQFLLNAKALGAEATEVAYEELYLSLQQGVVDGQENPLTNIDSLNLDEVQKFVSLSNHQLNSNLVIAGPKYDELNDEQKTAITDAVATAVADMPGCVEEAEQKILDGFESEGKTQVVDDVDVDAFSQQADAWFLDNLEGDSLAVYESIKNAQQ